MARTKKIKAENETVAKELDILKELDMLKAEIFPNIESGSLMIVTVGNEKAPATKLDIERVCDTINGIFESVKGVSVLVVPHLITIQKFDVPTLRNLESKIINSWNNDNKVTITAENLGIFGEI